MIRILLAEDEEAMRTYLARALQNAGYDVVSVDRGTEALPLLHSGIVESDEPNGPYGAKGASETAILPGAPAIANALFDAVGVRITELPITPEKVLAALRAQGGPR